MNATLYERRTWQGRKICDEKEMGGGYCGSINLRDHVLQMRDPKSWVHSSKDHWYQAALRAGGRKMVAGDL